MPTPKTKPATVEPEDELRGPLYELVYYADAGVEPVEDINLTAQQYAALKAHLADLTAPRTSDQDFRARMSTADQRAEVITNLLGDLNGIRLVELETVRLMSSRTYCGIDDPIAKFICGLIHQYGNLEAEGLGMTIEDVESELADLRENMAEALSEARFIADRYPRPEVTNAE